MSAMTSPYGGSSGRASVPGMDRAGVTARAGTRAPDMGYGDRYRASPSRDEWAGEEWPPRAARSGGPGGPGGPPGNGGGRGGAPYRKRRRPRWGRIALVVGALAVIGGIVATFSLYGYASSLDKDLTRTDPFAGLTNGRPAKTVDGALNIMLVGTDSRDPDARVDQAGEWRADTTIVMHIPADHDSAQLVSIPRDLYVRIPQSANAACDTGNRHKINAAFAFGGLPLAVRTVECMTDVHIDNVLAIDFGGFKEVTDALGGVDLKVERTIKSIHKPYRTFLKGTMHMNGTQALDWIRQRKQFPEGDFARMRHQQDFLKALMDKAASTGTLSSPKKLNGFLKASTSAVTADKSFSLVDMALQFRNLRSDNLTFITSPNKGSETINGESVVVADREKALALYQAITADKMTEWMSANLPAGKASAKK